MKKLICLFLGAAVVFSLAAGCTTEKNIGNTPPTTIAVGEDDINKALDSMGADLNNALDAAQKKAIADALALGVTIPTATEPIVTMPPPMPTGAQTKAEDVLPLMQNVSNILNSKKYTLKARGASPPTAGMPLGTTPITLAVDGDKSAFQVSMDWTNMMKTISQGTPEQDMAVINGAAMQTFMGKNVRFISKPDGDQLVMLDNRQFIVLPKGEGGEGEMNMSLASMFGNVFSPPKATGNVQASKVNVNGSEFLCAAVPGEQGIMMRYYFLGGALKRIELESKDPETGKQDVVVFEIESLTNTVDQAMFSTAGFRAMSVDEMASLGDSTLGGLLGG